MQKEQLHQCVNCGNVSTHELITQVEVGENIYDMNNDFASFGYNNYYIFLCNSCGQVSIFGDFFHSPPTSGNSIGSLTLIYPQIRDIGDLLPKKIKATYSEAKRVQHISAESFIILIRKSLELICDDMNATGPSLFSKINHLINKRILPEKARELANMIKQLGNIAAHDPESSMDFMDVDIIDELFVVLVEYVYLKGSNVDALKAKWNYLNGLQQED